MTGTLTHGRRGPGPAGEAAGRVHRTGAARWTRDYATRLAVTDTLVTLWAVAGAHLVTIGGLTRSLRDDPTRPAYVLLSITVAAVWLALIQLNGARDARHLGDGVEEYKQIVLATFWLFGTVSILAYLLAIPVPRSYLLVAMPSGLSMLLISRWAWRQWVHLQRQSGRYLTRVVVAGGRATVEELLVDLRRAPRSGLEVVGVCLAEDEAATYTSLSGVPVLGGLDGILPVLHASDADMLAITASSRLGPTTVRRLGWQLEDQGIDMVLAPALTDVAGPRVRSRPVHGLPLIQVELPRYNGTKQLVKRTFDVLCSGALLLALGPVLLAIACCVAVTSPGGVFFRQERVGRNNQTFRMIKFRSMVANAPELLGELSTQVARDAGNDVLFKMRDDPRVTNVGRFLRRYSLDELPQLVNVFLGDMSLVGPRPPLAAEVDRYEDHVRRRLLVKPGMTGLWQVSGRSDLSWEESVRLDLYYVENWSLTGDLQILWRTARAVVAPSGAY